MPPPSGTTAATAPPSNSDSYTCDPEPFSGDLNCWRRFLLQCRLVFAQRSHSFASDEVKINYIIGLLRSDALSWAQSSSSSAHLSLLTLEQFIQKFERIFGRPNHAGCALGLNDQVHNALVSGTCPKDLNELVDRVSSQSQS